MWNSIFTSFPKGKIGDNLQIKYFLKNSYPMNERGNAVIVVWAEIKTDLLFASFTQELSG